MIHHLALTMHLCLAPNKTSGQYVGLNQTQAAQLRHDQYRTQHAYLACRAANGYTGTRVP
ncbi:MAG: hypothetical protein ACXVGC_09830 [Mycobacteriaceae bacterium]